MIGHLPPRPVPDAAELGTPQPVYDPTAVSDAARPERIPESHRLRAMNAAVRARKAFPGPAGEILQAELSAWAEFGYAAHQAAPIARLVDQLMGEPFPPAA